MAQNRSHEAENRANPSPDVDPERNKPAAKVEEQSQKSQIAQYFKSQGRQPDDEIFNIGGLKLRLKDLE